MTTTTATAINKMDETGSTISVHVDHVTAEIYVQGVPQFRLEGALTFFEEIVKAIKEQMREG